MRQWDGDRPSLDGKYPAAGTDTKLFALRGPGVDLVLGKERSE